MKLVVAVALLATSAHAGTYWELVCPMRGGHTMSWFFDSAAECSGQLRVTRELCEAPMDSDDKRVNDAWESICHFDKGYKCVCRAHDSAGS
jgi:hypothetical protein